MSSELYIPWSTLALVAFRFIPIIKVHVVVKMMSEIRQDDGVIHSQSDVKKEDSIIDEKGLERATVSSVDLQYGDAALTLVGKERTAHFSEEYNLKLRKKLASPVLDIERDFTA